MTSLSLFPPDLPVWAFWLIIGMNFFAAAMTAALSIGGGLIMIGLMSMVAPPAAVVPVHGMLLLGSNAGRASVLSRHVDWKIVSAFALGGLVGATLGGLVATSLPANTLRLAIAGFILFSQWGPKFSLPLGRNAFAFAGLFSTALTLFVGATGPFVTTLLSRLGLLDRHGMVATAGACMTVQHGLKVLVFGVAGFLYAPWMGLIVLALISGFLGTVLGTKLLSQLPEARFRTALKWLLTLMAVYLIILAVSGLLKTG